MPLYLEFRTLLYDPFMIIFLLPPSERFFSLSFPFLFAHMSIDFRFSLSCVVTFLSPLGRSLVYRSSCRAHSMAFLRIVHVLHIR